MKTMNFFGNCATLDALKAEYKRLAKQYHPDMGGDTATMQAINAQYEAAFNRMSGNATNGTTETAVDFINIISALMKIKGIVCEQCGSWLWISGDTKPVKEQLKAAGCRWASKKKMWYWKPAGSYSRGSNASMDYIRAKYGSRIVTKRESDLAYA